MKSLERLWTFQYDHPNKRTTLDVIRMNEPVTRPNAMSREDRDKIMAEMLERIHTTGPFSADELSDSQRTDLKEVFKEAATEWLNEKFSIFGRWAFTSIAAFIFIGLVLLAMHFQGWHLTNNTEQP